MQMALVYRQRIQKIKKAPYLQVKCSDSSLEDISVSENESTANSGTATPALESARAMSPTQKKEKKKIKSIMVNSLLHSLDKRLWAKFDLLQNLSQQDINNVTKQMEAVDVYIDCCRFLV